MAWWTLTIKGKFRLTEIDKEHIAGLIIEGFTSGQLNNEEDEEEEPTEDDIIDQQIDEMKEAQADLKRRDGNIKEED
jgi:hypothetical protein